MPIPQLKETTIRDRATAKVFQRGEQYYRSGAVTNIWSRGDILEATVEGSEGSPYRISIQFDNAEIEWAHCTCPYAFEGWCKHMVATALHFLREPETLTKRPSLEQLLDRLNPIQTQLLIQKLVDEQPELVDDIELFVNRIAHPVPQPRSRAQRRTEINVQPYRARAKQLMRETLGYWEEGLEGDPIEEELPELLAQAEVFSERGEGNTAIAILATITQACAEEWDEIAKYGGSGEDVVSLIDPVLTEAILCTEFQPGEEIDLQINLEDWEERLDGHFNLSSAALRQGWEDAALQAVLRGESTQLWENNSPEGADQLARIRLLILERQGRQEEYLNLARAEGILPEYLTMLASLGRIEEVMANRQQIAFVNQALAVARALRERGAAWEALEIARVGLTLPDARSRRDQLRCTRSFHWATVVESELRGGDRYQLADWTSDLAEELGDRAAALSARMDAFKTQPSLQDYQNVERLAGENWSAVKGDLLEHLRQLESWGSQEARVEIFLGEGLIDDAIATLGSYGRDRLIHRVMDAAISHRPEWVIEEALPHAEKIINRGKADAYDEAAEWLSKARAAYLQSGRQTEWKSYRTELMTTHARKRKLMGFLKQSRLQ